MSFHPSQISPADLVMKSLCQLRPPKMALCVCFVSLVSVATAEAQFDFGNLLKQGVQSAGGKNAGKIVNGVQPRTKATPFHAALCRVLADALPAHMFRLVAT